MTRIIIFLIMSYTITSCEKGYEILSEEFGYLITPIAKESVILFTFDGQSNANGDGVAKYDTVDLSLTDEVPNCYVMRDTLQKIDASAGTARYPDDFDYFGPAMNLANELEDNHPLRTFFFAQYIVGGTSLGLDPGAEDWNIASVNELWDKYNTLINAAIALNEFTIYKMVRLVFQGEADALDEDFANAYYDNQVALINDYKSNYAVYNPVFIFFKIKTGYGPYNSTVRTAFDNLELLDDVYIINIDDVSNGPYGVHFPPEGYLEFGTRLYNKLVELGLV